MKFRIFSFLAVFFLWLGNHQAQEWAPQNGVNNPQNQSTVFKHANIYLGEGKWITDATLIIQKDRIKAIGKDLPIPDYAIVHDLQGKFIYPSFIEIYSEIGIPKAQKVASFRKPQLERKQAGPFYWNESIKPEQDAIDLYKHNEKQAKELRKLGFGSVLTHQQDGIIRGTSTLMALTDETIKQPILPKAAMQYSFYKGNSRQSYPTSLMGIIALLRQTHYDAQAYEDYREQLQYNQSLEALVTQRSLPKIVETGSVLSQLRADKIGNEFGFNFILKGNGQEYKRLADIKATESAVIVPLKFPKAYDVSNPFEAMQLPLAKMKEWELADENLVRLAKAQIPFAITTADLKKKSDFTTNLKRSIKKGLSHDQALKALTETPARLLKVDSILGKIEANYLANFLIYSDTLFAANSKLVSNWVKGKEFEVYDDQQIDIRGTYSLNVNRKTQFDLKIEGKKEKLSAKVGEKGKDEFSNAKIELEANRVNLWFTKDEVLYRLSGVVNDSLSRIWSGKTKLKGEWVSWAAIKKSAFEEKQARKETSKTEVKLAKVQYPLMAYGWDSLPTASETIIYRNATVWTNEKEGIQRKHDVLVHEGKIKMVGHNINLGVMFPELASRVIEYDATGLHLTSGIIDEHSHIAISRGVNESGQAITAEVSIGNVVNSDDINIYRQLSGGVTASQLLHGSANPIGGQSALVKLKWGQKPELMKIDSALGFIKFALGENVKQSNWGDNQTVRFPQTRMGVEQVFYDGFTRAREYKAEWTLYNAKSKREKKNAIKPRYDIELEVLAEILDTQRFVTCHSYIQSEINMLMHVADSMKFTLNTFTHVLEGYKVADKLREHGAAASTFSDWWAYKFEVNDAIPYNGALLHNQGVLTGFNSDDAEMGRRLNQEAAKAVKYGGLSAEEAWKFVTLNPAKMLHLDHRMGSIKAGKDADLVLWTGNPLSIYSKVVRTVIDGVPYYDAQRDQELRKRNASERERLIALMLEDKKQGKPTQKIKLEKKKLYECDSLEQ